MGYNTSLRR